VATRPYHPRVRLRTLHIESITGTSTSTPTTVTTQAS
jgi:hypothetical protein